MDDKVLGTSTVTQIAMLVHDVEATSKAFAELLGCECPAWFILPSDGEHLPAEYRGAPTTARAKFAFFSIGPNLSLELIEPDETPSIWREDLDKYGEGLHHIAFVIDGMQARTVSLQRRGMSLTQKGEYPGGRYAYFDARKDLKLVLELLEND